MRSCRILFAAHLAVSLAASTAFAGDSSFQLEDVNANFGTTSSMLTASFTWRQHKSLAQGFAFGLTGKLPASTNEEDADTVLDQFTNSWRAGATALYVLGWGDFNAYRMRFDIAPEWGIQQFVFYPNAGPQAASDWKNSFDLTASWHMAYVPVLSDAIPAPDARVYAVQLIARFANDWNAPDAVGVVSPGNGAQPATVTNKVIADAVTLPSIAARLFFFKRIGASGFAIGPSLAAVFSGPKDHVITFDTSIVGRAEFWAYFLPSSAKPSGLRLGISPTISVYFHGADSQGRTLVPGALFQVRYGSDNSPVYLY